MKTLYLLRHAKAEPSSATLHDEDRPLAPRGREACALMGVYMREKGYLPQRVLCSSAVRTRETLELVAASHGGAFPYVLEPRLYLATAGEMLAHIQRTDEGVDSLLLVGHNPGMHHLAALLARDDHTPLRATLELKYPTGTLTVLQWQDVTWASLAPGSGALVDFVPPSVL